MGKFRGDTDRPELAGSCLRPQSNGSRRPPCEGANSYEALLGLFSRTNRLENGDAVTVQLTAVGEDRPLRALGHLAHFALAVSDTHQLLAYESRKHEFRFA